MYSILFVSVVINFGLGGFTFSNIFMYSCNYIIIYIVLHFVTNTSDRQYKLSNMYWFTDHETNVPSLIISLL